MAPGVIFWMRIASPAGVSAQCAIHNTLLFKNSITQTYSLVSTAGHGAWSNQSLRVKLPRQQASVYSAPSTTSCDSRIQSLTHSLTRLPRQLAMAPGVIFWTRIASPAGVRVQCAIHSNLHFKKSITQSLTHSLVSTAGHGAWSSL